MFVGTSEKLKKKIQEFNDKSSWFIFSLGDLEPSYSENSGKRYNIVSPELKQWFEKIISQRKKPGDGIRSFPSIIDLELSEKRERENPGPWNYDYWLIVKKRHIYDQACHSNGNKIAISLNNKAGKWDINFTSCLGYVLDSDNHNRTEWKEIGDQEKNWVKAKIKKFLDTRSSAWEEIKNKIKVGNIYEEEALNDPGYFGLQPAYCYCADDPCFQQEYYFNHIISCLGREEKIIEFKNEVLKIVERNIAKLNQRKTEIITRAKGKAQVKGVQIDFGFWEEAINSWRNNEQLDGGERRLNGLISDLTNINEEYRKKREELAQERAREEQAQAQQKQERKEKEKKAKEEKAKQGAQERQEKLQKEQEEEANQFETRFKSENTEFKREREKADEKIEDLKRKLHDYEKLENDNDPFWKRKKEELEKEIWDLRMDNLSKTPPASSPSEGNDKDKTKENTDKDQNSSGSKSAVNYSVFAFLGAFLIVILIFFLLAKRKK